MMNKLEQAVNRLWLTYKLYGEVSKNQLSDYDSNQFATESTNGFLDYIREMSEDHPHWRDNLPSIVENQVRIVTGLCEMYDRPVKRDRVTAKTRWSL